MPPASPAPTRPPAPLRPARRWWCWTTPAAPNWPAAPAERFTQGGWTVTETSTFEGDILSTAAYYDPATPGAQAAAEALQRQFPEIQRVRPKFVGLGPGPVIVVLTYDYSQGLTTS